jgi:hypothetical protein
MTPFSFKFEVRQNELIVDLVGSLESESESWAVFRDANVNIHASGQPRRAGRPGRPESREFQGVQNPKRKS